MDNKKLLVLLRLEDIEHPRNIHMIEKQTEDVCSKDELCRLLKELHMEGYIDKLYDLTFSAYTLLRVENAKTAEKYGKGRGGGW